MLYTDIDMARKNLLQKHKQMQALYEKLHVSEEELGERIKELNCLYGISRLIVKQNISLDEILQGIVDCIPYGCLYPEITCARILLNDQEFRTKNFKDTVWKLSCAIYTNSERIGILEVCYLEEKPEKDEGPFLREERNLINTIAEQAGKIIEQKQAQEALQAEKAYLNQLFESAHEAIVMCDSNQRVLRINSEFTRLFGYTPKEAVGRFIDDLVASEDLTKEAELYTKHLGEGRKVAFESVRQRKDGSFIDVSAIGSPILVGKEKLGFYAIYRDITERKKAE